MILCHICNANEATGRCPTCGRLVCSACKTGGRCVACESLSPSIPQHQSAEVVGLQLSTPSLAQDATLLSLLLVGACLHLVAACLFVLRLNMINLAVLLFTVGTVAFLYACYLHAVHRDESGWYLLYGLAGLPGFLLVVLVLRYQIRFVAWAGVVIHAAQLVAGLAVTAILLTRGFPGSPVVGPPSPLQPMCRWVGGASGVIAELVLLTIWLNLLKRRRWAWWVALAETVAVTLLWYLIGVSAFLNSYHSSGLGSMPMSYQTLPPGWAEDNAVNIFILYLGSVIASCPLATLIACRPSKWSPTC